MPVSGAPVTNTHNHLFLSEGQQEVREGVVQSSSASLPIEEWQELLTEGWGQISDFKFDFY